MTSPLSESEYLQRVDKTFRAITDAFEDVDADVVDVYFAGDVLTLAFANGIRCVVNTQRPVRQIWAAARARAWHFDWDAAAQRWMDDRGSGDDLATVVTRVVKDEAGIDVALATPAA